MKRQISEQGSPPLPPTRAATRGVAQARDSGVDEVLRIVKNKLREKKKGGSLVLVDTGAC